ncbi:hypothetical protein FRC01_008454 [Tulasnella sp. 417]|nr:hypothetical protein FRC01_008454 [Tulasnella sp. 417]
MPPRKPGSKLKQAKGGKKSDNRDDEDAIETEQAVEKTTGALGALNKRKISKDPPAITGRNTRQSKVLTTQVGSDSPLTIPTTLSPSSAAPPLPTGSDDDEKSNKGSEEDYVNEMEDRRGMEDGRAILVQLDLVHMENRDIVESVYATIQKTLLGPGSTVTIQDLVLKVEATPPMSARAFVLHRGALIGDGKVAIGSVKDIIAGTAPLLSIKQLSKVTLEDKGGIYHTVLWYKPIEGEKPLTLAKIAPQSRQTQPGSGSNSANEPNQGFNQSNHSPEVLEWLREELDGPTAPLPGAGTLKHAWDREKLYRKVKAKADELFKHKQSYKINTGPYDGTVFRVDALQDICYLRHTNCALSTAGFAKAEQDPEMARWMNGKARDGDTNFSSWSIATFWKEAEKRLEIAKKKALAHEEKKQGKGKERQERKPKKRVQSSDEEESQVEEMDSDDLDTQKSSKTKPKK